MSDLNNLLTDGNEGFDLNSYANAVDNLDSIDVQELEFDESIDYRDYPVVEPADESDDDTIRQVHWNCEE